MGDMRAEAGAALANMVWCALAEAVRGGERVAEDRELALGACGVSEFVIERSTFLTQFLGRA